MADNDVAWIFALPKRFLAKFEVTPSGCWEWTRGVSGNETSGTITLEVEP